MVTEVVVPQEWWRYPPWVESVAGRVTQLKVGRILIYRRVTASTNDDVRLLAREGAPDGLVVVADEQTHGRGRLGRPWIAPAEACLLLSVLFRRPFPMERVGQLSMIMGLAALDAIQGVTGLRAGLKWPNDIILADRKVGGILSEVESQGKLMRWAIVGLGLNANADFSPYPELAETAVSLAAVLGREVDRSELLASLLRSLSARYARLVEGSSPVEEWQARLGTLGRRVSVRTARDTVTGEAEFVSDEGSLFVRLDDGSRCEVFAGDVQLSEATE